MIIWWKKESANKIEEKDKNIGNPNGRINSTVQFPLSFLDTRTERKNDELHCHYL